MKGHLRQRGDAWELRAYAGTDPTTGRQKYVTRTFRGGKRAAEDALARLVIEVSGGGHAAQDATVGDLVRQWMELATPELSPSTVRGYDLLIRTQIIPAIGKVRLARLTAAQLDHFYARLRQSGGQDNKPLAPATVRQVHAIVRRALQQGVRWGWIATNPAALASPPRVRRSQLEPPDPSEVVRMIETAAAADPDFGCFLRVAATTGARRGELCALRWRDVDLAGRTITISRAVVEGANKAVVEKDTKTHGSRRIAIDEVTAAALQDQLERARAQALACGLEGLSPRAAVFSRRPDGSPWPPNDVTKAFIRLRKAVGLPEVRLHDLRHFAATRLLNAGVPVRTVSGRLGHANASTTLGVYAHFVEQSDRDAAEKLSALINPPGSAATGH